MIHQYQIVIVNLEPTIGHEIKKTRPCVVLSPNEINHHLRTIVIAPLTSTNRYYPTRVTILNQGRESRVALDQIRVIDQKRVIKIGARLSTSEIKTIKALIKEIYVD